MFLDIHKTLENLFKSRPIFHSEDDFKFALAWQIKIDYQDVEIRLERVYKDMHIDIVVIYKENTIGIELKYPTQKLEKTYNGEKFTLTYHAGQGQRRFEFYKDINRLEKLKNQNEIAEGHVILLTNDKSYKKPTAKKSITNNEFNIQDQHPITNKQYEWKADKDKSRDGQIINITGKYLCKWNNLKDNNEDNNEFMYLHLKI